MEYIFRSLTDIILKGVAGLADMLNKGTLEMLTLNIGDDSSVFSIVFGGFKDFYEIILILAWTLLVLNLIWQLMTTMISPNGGEHPGSLIVSTIIAGVFISAATTVIGFAEDIFCQFYDYMLTMDLSIGTNLTTAAAVDNIFKGVSDGILAVVSSSANATVAGAVAAQAAPSIAEMLFVLLLLLAVVYEFVMYMIEIVERYIVLGVLYYTSPLAVAMAGSKSTRPVFASWVRMVMSQMFLMLCNVIFYRLFLEALKHYNGIIQTIENAHSGTDVGISVSILYMLMLYGILYVGTKIDTYLNTLGLSAAQTGRGLGAAMAATALGVRRTLDAGFGIGKFALNTKAGKAATKATGNAVRTGAQKISQATGIGGKQATKDKATGTISQATWNNAFDKKLNSKDYSQMQGADASRGFLGALKNVDTSKIDHSSFQFDPSTGAATMKTKGKNPSIVGFTELTDKNRSELTAQPGKVVSGEFDGKKREFFMQASGGDAHAVNSMLSKDEAMETFMQKDGARAGVSWETLAPGVHLRTQTDAAGHVVSAERWAMSSISSTDAAYNPSYVTPDGGTTPIEVTDVTAAMAGFDTFGSKLKDFSTAAPPRLQRELKSAFSPQVLESIGFNGVSGISGSKDVLYIQHDEAHGGGGSLMFSSARYAMTPQAVASGDYTTMQAGNGAQYCCVRCSSPQSDGFDITNYITKRDTPLKGSCPAPTMKAPVTIPYNSNALYDTANKKKKK